MWLKIRQQVQQVSLQNINNLINNVQWSFNINTAIQSMGETQVELQGQVVDEPGNLQQVAVSQEPQSFADMGAVEELMETVSDDEGSITRGGSGLEDEEGRQDLTGPQR